MLLIDHAMDAMNGQPLLVTHSVNGDGARAEHTISVYKPGPARLGPLAGELLQSLILTGEQAAELKAHL